MIIRYQFTQGMWFKEPDRTKVLFDTQMDVMEYKFTQSMWSEESGRAEVLFTTQKNDFKILTYPMYVVRGAKQDQGSV